MTRPRLHIGIHHLPHIAAGMFALVMLLGSLGPFAISSKAHAELVTLRSLQLSDSTTGAQNVKYNVSFTTATMALLGSIRFQICSNYVFNPGDPCTPPPGFNGSGATLTAQTGVTDFAKSPASTSNDLLITRQFATNIAPQPVSYEFSNITNPSAVQTMYVRISTYGNTSGTGVETDYGNVLAATNNDITIMTEVPPYLFFCTGVTIQGLNCGTADGSFISFGELSTKATSTATSQFLIGTNADFGYSITLDGTTMMAGNNVIPAMSGEGAQTGVSQFGINARTNTAPVVGGDPAGPGLNMPKPAYGTPNSFRFNRGDVIAADDHPDDYRKMTVSYIVNRAPDQAPGRYVSTITYIALGNF